MDALDTVMSVRTLVVAERDGLRSESDMLKEAGWGTAVGTAVGGASKALIDLGPLAYIGLPALAGVGAAKAYHDMRAPSKGDVHKVSKELLKAKNEEASRELDDLVEEFGPGILEPSKENRGVRL